MTRETKVGLVVASAFVGLTTVVVVSRLKPPPAEAPARAPIIVTAPTPPPQSLAIPGPAPGSTPGANPPKVLPASAFEAAPLNGTQDPAPPSQTIKDGINPQTAPALPQTQSANPADGKPEFDFKIPEQMVQNPPGTAAAPALPTPSPATVPAAAPAVNPNTKPETPALPAAPASPPTTTAQDPKYRSLDFHKPSSPTTDPATKPANPQPISLDKLGPAPAPAVPVPGSANPPANPDATKPNPTAPSPATPNSADVTNPATPSTTPAANPPAPAPLPATMGTQPGSPATNPQLPAGPSTGAAPGQAPLPPAPLPATPAAKPLTDPAPVVPPAVPGPTPAGTTNPAPVPAPGSPAVSPAPAPAGLSGKPAVETPPTGPAPNPAPAPGMPSPLTTPGSLTPAAPGPSNTSKNDLPGGPRGTEVTQTGAQEKGIPGAAPPVGAPANVGSPPIQVPVPAPAPKAAAAGNPDVRSWEVQTYTCKPEDTSLKALSARFYKSPDYAEALLRYNRDSLEGAPEELRADPPQPRAGTRIQIPPVWLLEARYPGAIPNLKPLPDVPARGSVSTGQSSPVSQPDRTPPVVAVTRPAGGPSAVPPVPVPTPGQGGLVPVRAGPAGWVYTVGRGGEMFAQIAERVYGDFHRWNDIWRVNQQISNPHLPIPEGTQLQLPPDARAPR